MSISEMISVNTVLLDLSVANKMQLIQELSGKVAELANIDRRVIFDSVWEREMLGSTGYGHGTAFPHARVAGVDQVFVYQFIIRICKTINSVINFINIINQHGHIT